MPLLRRSRASSDKTHKFVIPAKAGIQNYLIYPDSPDLVRGRLIALRLSGMTKMQLRHSFFAGITACLIFCGFVLLTLRPWRASSDK